MIARESYTVDVHDLVAGNLRGRNVFRVVRRKEGRVKLSRWPDSDHGPEMPEESLPHFLRDLEGRVEGPPHGRKEIDAVLSGKATFLGKGHDGLVFRVGPKVVKVSTTVPYQPENPGHRTPAGAAEMLRLQAEVGNKLAALGVAVQKSAFVLHGGKGFQIKSYVTIPKCLTLAQLDAAQQAVQGMHAAGYSLNDTVQVGIERGGRVVLFDIGSAASTIGRFNEEDDYSNLRRLYETR